MRRGPDPRSEREGCGGRRGKGDAPRPGGPAPAYGRSDTGHGGRPQTGERPSRSGGRGAGQLPSSQRAEDRKTQGSPRRDRHHLRIQAQRDGGCLRAVLQGGKRLYPEGRKRRPFLQSGDRGEHPILSGEMRDQPGCRPAHHRYQPGGDSAVHAYE